VVDGAEGDLRNKIDPDRAGAIIRALTGVQVYVELVAGEGWTPDDYELWLANLLGEVLIGKR
jgi:hypothetical protein